MQADRTTQGPLSQHGLALLCEVPTDGDRHVRAWAHFCFRSPERRGDGAALQFRGRETSTEAAARGLATAQRRGLTAGRRQHVDQRAGEPVGH